MPLSRAAARLRSSTSCACAIARRSTNGVRASTASRSTSRSTPMISPRGVTSGRWRMPPSSMRQDRVGRARLGRDGHDGAGHDLGHRGVRGAAGGEHAPPQVAVGDDAEGASGGADQHAARALLDHPARGLAHRQRRVAQDDRLVAELLDAQAARVDRRGERHRPRQQRDRVGRAQPDTHRLLRRPRLEARRSGPREHRAMPEQLALAEAIEGPSPVQQLHGTPAHQPHAVGRLALGQDHRAGRERLDGGAAGDRLEVARLEPAEQLVRAQELRDVVGRRAHRWARAVSRTGGAGRRLTPAARRRGSRPAGGASASAGTAAPRLPAARAPSRAA